MREGNSNLINTLSRRFCR